jgi:ferredoxin
MRRWVQLAGLGLFGLLFALNPLAEKLVLPPDLFLKADPLLGFSAFLSSRRFHESLLYGLPVLLLALTAGRFFCGWLCPLGTLFDLCTGKNPSKKLLCSPLWKLSLLVMLAAAALLGLNLAGFVDPLAFLTRVFTFIAYPLVMLATATGIELLRPLADYLRLITLSHAQVAQPLFSLILLTVVLCSGLFALNYRFPRFWCRSFCPLGSLLGLVTRIGFFRRQVANTCTTCMKCAHTCPTGAILDEPRQYLPEECIYCTACTAVCPVQAVSFRLSSAPPLLPDIQRRGLLVSAATGAFAAFAVKKDVLAKINPNRLIRPPGAWPEPEFQGACIRCSQCMKICPTNTLQPCLFESGISGIWSPRLDTRRAGCDQTCALCGTVCPTGAIRELPLEEKKYAKLGTAAIDTGRCLVWAQDRLCLICDEQCPYNAIVFKWKDGSRKPFVIDTRCNGCGFCEQVCPVQGRSAIEVSQHGEIRLSNGSYIEKAKELQIELKENAGDDAFIMQDSPSEKLPDGVITK